MTITCENCKHLPAEILVMYRHKKRAMCYACAEILEEEDE